MSNDHAHVTVERDGRVVAEAQLHIDRDRGVVQADLHIEAGHQPPGSGTELVDAVLENSAAAAATHLQATLPAGNAETLSRLQARCSDIEARAAGATVLVEAALPDH